MYNIYDKRRSVKKNITTCVVERNFYPKSDMKVFVREMKNEILKTYRKDGN